MTSLFATPKRICVPLVLIACCFLAGCLSTPDAANPRYAIDISGQLVQNQIEPTWLEIGQLEGALAQLDNSSIALLGAQGEDARIRLQTAAKRIRAKQAHQILHTHHIVELNLDTMRQDVSDPGIYRALLLKVARRRAYQNHHGDKKTVFFISNTALLPYDSVCGQQLPDHQPACDAQRRELLDELATVGNGVIFGIDLAIFKRLRTSNDTVIRASSMTAVDLKIFIKRVYKTLTEETWNLIARLVRAYPPSNIGSLDEALRLAQEAKTGKTNQELVSMTAKRIGKQPRVLQTLIDDPRSLQEFDQEALLNPPEAQNSGKQELITELFTLVGKAKRIADLAVTNTTIAAQLDAHAQLIAGKLYLLRAQAGETDTSTMQSLADTLQQLHASLASTLKKRTAIQALKQAINAVYGDLFN